MLVTAMFCKWCEMAGFKHNDRGKPAVWTGAGEGCQRAKLESVKDHEATPTHKQAANLQMNQIDMKEASVAYGTYLPIGIYGPWLQIFVSARTNKRHHHPDVSKDSDIPKNDPFTFVINNRNT